MFSVEQLLYELKQMFENNIVYIIQLITSLCIREINTINLRTLLGAKIYSHYQDGHMYTIHVNCACEVAKEEVANGQ